MLQCSTTRSSTAGPILRSDSTLLDVEQLLEVCRNLFVLGKSYSSCNRNNALPSHLHFLWTHQQVQNPARYGQQIWSRSSPSCCRGVSFRNWVSSPHSECGASPSENLKRRAIVFTLHVIRLLEEHITRPRDARHSLHRWILLMDNVEHNTILACL